MIFFGFLFSSQYNRIRCFGSAVFRIKKFLLVTPSHQIDVLWSLTLVAIQGDRFVQQNMCVGNCQIMVQVHWLGNADRFDQVSVILKMFCQKLAAFLRQSDRPVRVSHHAG